MRGNSVQVSALQMRLQGHPQGACHRSPEGRSQNPRKVGIPRNAGHLTIKGIAIFAP